MSGKTLFTPGNVVATDRAGAALVAAGVAGFELLERHLHGDWGDISPEGREENDRALESRGRLISSYTLHTRVRIWVLTNPERSSTTLLLPSEYPPRLPSP